MADFIRVVGEGKHFIFILSAGNGLGKTAGLMNIVANIVWGPQNEWFKYPLYEAWPFPKRIRVVTEAKNVEEIGAIDQEIKRWWPLGKYKASKSGKNFFCLYEMDGRDGKWVMDKMSYEQDLTEFESSTLGCIIYDEPPPKAIFDAGVSRMREGGIIIVNMTPLGGAGWIFDELIDSHDHKTHIAYGSMEDACLEHGVRGHLKHENIQKMLDYWEKADPDAIAARRDGKPLQTASSILGRYLNRDVHLLDDDVKCPVGSSFGYTVDPADGKPYAIGFWWVDPRGHIVFDDEWPKEDWLMLLKNKKPLPKMEDYARIFKEYEAGKPMEYRILDRHFGNNRNVLTGKTLSEDYADLYGIDFQDSYSCEKEMEVGIMKTIEYLQYDKTQPLTAMNVPRLYVKKRCKNIWKSLEKWSRKIDPEKYVPMPDRDSPWKDHVDVVRYTVMAHPEVGIYRPPPTIDTTKKYIMGR